MHVGIRQEVTLRVDDVMCIDFLGKDARVLSTPSMIDAVERLCREMVKPYLNGDDTVGIMVDAKHIAPTPVGMSIRIVASLVNIDGKRLTFKAEVYDDVEKVGEVIHERYVISKDRFIDKVRSKLASYTRAGSS